MKTTGLAWFSQGGVERGFRGRANGRGSIRRTCARAALGLLLPAALVISSTAPSVVLAQQEVLDEIVVTGTRRAGLSPTETLSPVDLIHGDAVSLQGTFDLTDSLSKVSPSLNTQRFPIADGTALIRPVSLRNLSPDHTLVLVDGIRRHRSALVNLQLAPLGTVNQGSQAVDWGAFPAAAIERVEILRDGASAQYGSDAIAGVINVILKDDAEGGSVSAQYGSYYAGDGDRLSVSANAGLPLTTSGFLNLTGEYSTSDITWRGVARPDAAAVGDIVGRDQVPLRGLGQRWGDPDIEALKFFVNSGIAINDQIDLYGFASYMDSKIVSDFFYREPVIDPQPAGIAARRTLQIDDDGDGLPDPAPQSLVDDIVARGLNPEDYLVADAGSPSGFVLRNPIHTEFPGGYNPDFGADIEDFAVALGLRGTLANNLSWDVHGRYAQNEIDYTVSQTINPSLGRLSPLSFRPGKLTQEESGLNVEFVQTFDDLPLNVAFGAELRNETYKIGAGDPASIEAGPTAAVFGVGSDGFQGFPVESAGRFKSDSWAAYVDVETDLTDRLSGAIAFRYEDYDEFGNTFDWKVAARLQVTPDVALRATANTGFRAPTPGQINTLNVTTTATPAGTLVPSGTYPVGHPVAVALGAVPLKPEDSQNYTFGIVWAVTENTSITLDYYHIEIDDRLALLNNTIGPDELALLIAAGVPDAELLEGSVANFFVNAFDSEIDGIDLAVTSLFPLGRGNLIVDLRHNFNEQKVSNVTPGTINASRVFDLENQVPQNSSVLTFDYAMGRFDTRLRFNYYEGWKTTGGLFSPGDASDQYSYGSAVLVDLEARFRFNDTWMLTVGGENIFDKFPGAEQEPVAQFLGVKHALTSPYGFNGGFWYLRASAQF